MMKLSQNLKSRFWMAIFLLLLGLITIVTAIVAGVQLKRTEDVSKRYLVEKAENISDRLDTYISEMDAVSTQILGSSTLQRMFVEAESPQYEGKNYFDYNKEEKKVAQDILWSHRTYQGSVKNIQIFKDSTYVGMGYSLSPQEITELSGKDIWKVPETENYRVLGNVYNRWGDNERVVSFIRPFIATTYRMQNVGTIEVQAEYEIFEEACSIAGTELAAVVFQEDDIIYMNQSGNDVTKEQCRNFLSGAEKENVVYKTDSHLYVSHTLQNAGWTVLLMQNTGAYQKQFAMIILYAVVAGTVLSLLVLFIVYGAVHRLTKPILQFAEDIRQVDKSGEMPPWHTSNIKEIIILQNSYKYFFEKIKEAHNELLLARETELQLRIQVLQEQVNPHFLFNSLTAISAASMERGEEKVPIMCYQLSSLFRYSSNNAEMVTLEEEIGNIETYLQFVSWRYEDNLKYVMEKEGDLSGIRIPKMIFQPLVENCFTHGFKSIFPPYQLNVQCIVKEKEWIFYIADNGKGEDSEKIELIRTQMEEIRRIILETHQYKMLKTQNMAILNIYTRLLLQYRENVKFEISGKSDLGGVEIYIVINCAEGTDGHDKSSYSR